MRLSKPFDFDSGQIKVLSGIVSAYHERTKEKMAVPGAWRSMDDEDLWMHLTRIIIAIGKSAPSYRLMDSKDARRLSIASMRQYQAKHGDDALIKEINKILAAYNVRYCSPQRETSPKAVAIVRNLNESYIVDGEHFALMENIIKYGGDEPRFFITEIVHMYGMKSASEFLKEIGYSSDYMAFDSRLIRVLSLVFEKDFNKQICVTCDYLDIEAVFREEICPELGVTPAELDSILFWNYADIIKSLKR
jgi:thermostable 8-oxoguanine DNA glycosylase